MEYQNPYVKTPKIHNNLLLHHNFELQGPNPGRKIFDRLSTKEKYVEGHGIDRSLAKELQNPVDYI